MITGIIVFSHTGNTLYAARKLEEKFKERGWGVNLERITTTPILHYIILSCRKSLQ